MLARLVILITAPFVLGFTFIAGVVSGVRMAWLDCCVEVESIRPYWKAKSLRKVPGNE